MAHGFNTPEYVESLRVAIDDEPANCTFLAIDDDKGDLHTVVRLCSLAARYGLHGVKFARGLLERYDPHVLNGIVARQNTSNRGALLRIYLDVLYKKPIDQVKPQSATKTTPWSDYLSIDASGGRTYMQRMLQVQDKTLLVAASADPYLADRDEECIEAYGAPFMETSIRHAEMAADIGYVAFGCTYSLAKELKSHKSAKVRGMLRIASGVRMPDDPTNNRHDTVTPAEMLEYADMINIGRAITENDNWEKQTTVMLENAQLAFLP